MESLGRDHPDCRSDISNPGMIGRSMPVSENALVELDQSCPISQRTS
jgi:hypothetical protein